MRTFRPTLTLSGQEFFRGVLILAPLPVLLFLWIGGMTGWVMGLWLIFGMSYIVLSGRPQASSWGSAEDESLEEFVREQ